MDLTGKDERFVEIQFRKIMKREIRDIERDIESISWYWKETIKKYNMKNKTVV